MQEIWKIIAENDKYEVSNIGQIRNSKTKKIILQQQNSSNYKIVHLRKNSHRKVYFVHRLVASLFVDNPNDKNIVNHIDGNKHNNNSSNLEWVTQSENFKHAWKNGLIKKTPKMIENAKMQLSKITPEQFALGQERNKIVHRNKSRRSYLIDSLNQTKPLKCIELNRVFLCAKRVEEKLGIKKSAIQKAMSKGYKTCGGYHWVYLKSRF